MRAAGLWRLTGHRFGDCAQATDRPVGATVDEARATGKGDGRAAGTHTSREVQTKNPGPAAVYQ